MKKLSTVFFLMLMPMMSIAQTGTIKVKVIDTSDVKRYVLFDSSTIPSIPARNDLNQLIGLTPGVISDNSTGHGHVISSNCNFGRRHSDPNYCTPPNRGSVMIDTPTLQTTISRFAVSDFNCPTSGAEQTPTQQKSIAITPNPSNSIVRLSFESENETGIAIHIYNSRGAIVRTIRDDAVAVGDWSRTISMSDCVEGTYLVQLIQGSDIRMGRFMLLKQ